MATELSPALRSRLDNQLRAWQQELVSLDRRQKLIYFKHLRSGSLELVTHSPEAVLNIVTRGQAILVVDDPDSGLQAGRLPVADKSELEIAAATRRMDLTCQSVFVDRAFWTLYLGLGMLRWIDPASGEETVSPLVLCPVEVKREGTQAPYMLSRRDEEALVNPALKLHLERTFDLSLPEVDGETPGLESFFASVRSSIARHSGWEIQSRTVLTTFSFHKEAIYRDLVDNTELIAGHALVQALALGGAAPGTAALAFDPPADRDLDEKHPPERMLLILDADSSQRRCIVSAAGGHSFVMDGPPGTGKSQTIANIIAELIATEKTVLFVSEKAAALDVVRNRLADKQLGDFLFELHSHAATRKEVVQQLSQSLTRRVVAPEMFTGSQRLTLALERRELTAFADAMNLVRQPLARSLFQVVGRLMELESPSNKPLGELGSWIDLTPERLAEIIQAAESLATAWRPVSEDDFLWRDITGFKHSQAEVRSAADASRKARESASSLDGALRTLESDLLRGWPCSLPSSKRWHSLLILGAQHREAPDGWLTTVDLGEVVDLAATRRVEVGQIFATEENARAILGVQARSVSMKRGAGVRLIGEDRHRLWGPVDSTSTGGLAAAHALLGRLPGLLTEILNDAVQLASMMGMATSAITLVRAAELAGLASLGGSAALPERAWLNPAIRAALDQSQQVLAALVTVVKERHEAVAEVFTSEALNLDLAELDTRFRNAHTGFGRWSGTARADRKALKQVTITRKANKAVRVMLSEAASWQRAERELSSAEVDHGPRLGGYYRRVDTDFDRVAAAVQVAQSAIRLAGDDLNQGALADQISVGGSPDPRLTLIAKRLATAVGAVRVDIEKFLGADSLEYVLYSAIDSVIHEARTVEAELLEPLNALTHLAEVAGRDLTCGEAARGYEELVTVGLLEDKLSSSHANDVDSLGSSYDGVGTNWAAMEAQLAWAESIRNDLGGSIATDLVRRLRSPYISPEELRGRMEAWVEARDSFARFFGGVRARELVSDLDADLSSACDLLEQLEHAAVEDIAEWDAYVSNVQRLRAAGLSDVVDHLVVTRAESPAVAGVVEWAALQAWVEATVVADDRLSNSRAADRDAQVHRFREHDAELVSKTYADVVNACSALRPGNYASSGAQLIMREAQKKTRHLPIRELLSRTHEIVQALKPCFMMSPLSVSQFLPSGMTFDVVIFDEASQVLPSDAVNCIYRSSQLIVAGDERQLPPTSFFASTMSDDGTEADDEVDSFESVLKLCKSTMPSLPLTWHYRSQHESLITYSNYRFYAPDGQPLQSFPGAKFTAPDLGVESIVVDGVYRRGMGRDNPVEAEKVAERVAFHRQNHPNLSIGVVTFSTAQEDAIVAAIERRSLVERSLVGLLDDHNRLEGFFVKNLENVQGDERDIIIFSVGYGPDEFGKFTMNFGPLNRDGGWRRLNVAITRARRRVEVISSFEAGQMVDSETEGVRHLKGYLDFAARGIPALGLDLTGSLGDVESPFEEDVLAVIRSWGYVVVPQVGSAGYRLDLGVKHPERPGEYVLGVECDGAAYHSAATARDRDRLRAGVLEGLGWKLHRIWGLSWYRDRARQSELLRKAIEAAVADMPQATEPDAYRAHVSEVVIEEIDPDAMPAWAEPYRIFDGTAFCPYELHEPEARPYLERFLLPLFQCEAPMHKDLVNRRIRDAYGVGRIGHRIQDNIDAVVGRLNVNGSAIRIEGSFYTAEVELTRVRLPSDGSSIRSIVQVPREELDLATLQLIKSAVTMQESDVAPSLGRLFGWARSGVDIQAAVGASVGRGLANDWLERTKTGALRAREH